MVLGNHSVVGDCSSAGVSEFLGVRGLLGAPELWASGDSFFSPTGTVTFKDGRTLLGTASLNGGEATFTTNGLAPGSHSIAVQNGGNGDFLAGDSPALTLTVSVIASSFPAESVLTASVRSSANGEPVTLTDTVKPRGAVRGTPTGPVIFMNGGQVLPTVALKGGMAVWKTTSLRVGSDRIQAVYAGAGSFESSASAILVERIVAARTKKAPARRAMALKTAVESANPRWRVPEQAK
jgi:hypothetical protein